MLILSRSVAEDQAAFLHLQSTGKDAGILAEARIVALGLWVTVL